MNQNDRKELKEWFEAKTLDEKTKAAFKVNLLKLPKVEIKQHGPFRYKTK